MDLSRRDERTQPGVLTPGIHSCNGPPCRGGRLLYSTLFWLTHRHSMQRFYRPFSIPNPPGRMLFGLGAVLQHSHTPSLRVTGFEDDDEDENENEAPCER
jgi:hypothetical protein